MAKLKATILCFIYLAACAAGLSLPASAAQAPAEIELSDKIKKIRDDGIKVLDNNQIPLLDNRFRVDHEVKEITLLFFRSEGSPPVILVRPDGSKMYATLGVIGQAEWFDEKTYDLIRIKNPMPGPWQAIGQLSKGSKVLIVTDFELNVDPLPEILIQGETIKITGYFTNNGVPIRARNFRDVITLNIDFISTNNKKYTNFGAGIQEVTRFKDDGKGFDERPGDGIFTGEFVLNFPSGEWVPKYYINTPLMTRELENDPIIINPNPVKVSVEKTDQADEFHKLKIEIIGDYVKPESMVFQGKVFYPNQDVQSFSITDSIPEPRIFNIINYDYGLYRVQMSGFGVNANGREFMLDIPEFSFSIDPPPIEETGIPAEGELGADGMPLNQDIIEEPEPEPVDHTGTIILIAAANLLIILFGWLFVKVFIHGNGLKFNFKFKLPKINLKRKKKDEGEQKDGENKGRDKIQSEDDDILDLSLPDS